MPSFAKKYFSYQCVGKDAHFGKSGRFTNIGLLQIMTIRGGIKKKTVFFFQKNSERGGKGLAKSEISLSEKTEIFLEFFFERGGVPPIPKGCYHKKWGYWDIFAKKGALTQSIGMLSKKN